jgi:hypothetical protein
VANLRLKREEPSDLTLACASSSRGYSKGPTGGLLCSACILQSKQQNKEGLQQFEQLALAGDLLHYT